MFRNTFLCITKISLFVSLTIRNQIKSYFERGLHTYRVPSSLFHGNRTRLMNRLKGTIGISMNGGFVVLQGGEEVPFNDTDVNYEFRQESYFQWCFGVEEPGCFGALDITKDKSILFVPRLSAEYEIWCGKNKTSNEFKIRYSVDETYYVDEITKILKEKNAQLLFTLRGQNSDSGLFSREAYFDGINDFSINNEILYPIISECRVIKSPQEIEVLRYVIKVSCDAHKIIMSNVCPGMSEYHCESDFKQLVYSTGGCRHVSYTCICATGQNASILHYGHAGAPNNKAMQDGELCLFDMGANYCGYAADITCTYPVNGKFTNNQKMIYNAVLNARNAVLKAAKPGVSWVTMHLLANRVLLASLKDGGLLCGEVDDMMDAGLNEVFQPHGLGHLLGLDVHDVGGYLPGSPEKPTEPGVRKLRTARILLPGMVLTIEPGCYFIDSLLDSALANPKQKVFLNIDELKKFRGFGGVRIEDDVLITNDGVENLSKLPRTVEEIETLMEEKLKIK